MAYSPSKNNSYTFFFQTCVAILALAAAALAAPSGPAPAPAYGGPVYADAPPLYTFGYNVNNKEGYEPQLFTHDENRDGYQTHGEYSVALPDGRIQRVVYRVDGDSGFIADVTYEGEARPYEYIPKPAPAYKPLPAPAPVVYKPAPAPKPAPVVYKPAPLPAPVPAYTTRYLPAPVAYAPAPAPVVVKAAPAPAPAPAPVEADRSGKSAGLGSNSKFNFGEVRFNPFG